MNVLKTKKDDNIFGDQRCRFNQNFSNLFERLCPCTKLCLGEGGEEEEVEEEGGVGSAPHAAPPPAALQRVALGGARGLQLSFGAT